MFLYGITFALSIALLAPSSPAVAQEAYKMGVSASEKNSTRVNLPNVMNKQDNKGPYLNHLKVSTQNNPEAIKQKEGQASHTDTTKDKTANTEKNGAEKEASGADEKLKAEPKEADREPSELDKRLNSMGINADSMTDTVFLRHVTVSTSDE